MYFSYSGYFPFFPPFPFSSHSLVDTPSVQALSPQASPPPVNTPLSRQPVCDTDSRRCKHTREGHRMCELFVLFPFDKLSSVGTAQGFDPSDLSTLWKTVNTLPDPLLCLCV